MSGRRKASKRPTRRTEEDGAQRASVPPDDATREGRPEQPESRATGRPDTPDAGPTRRGFLGRIWLWLGGLAVAEYVWLAFEFLRPPVESDAELPVVEAGPLEAFEPGSVTAFPAGKYYLVRLEDGGFLALSRTCTHLGCTVPWLAEEGRFLCPCHSSAFDMRGEVINPPAPRPLDLHPVRIENGIVKVDLGQTIRRRDFEPSQVTRA